MNGKIALITGAGRGIGAATALRLARAGARVCLTSRTRSELEQVVAQIRSSGGAGAQALAVECDVGDPAAVARLFDRIEAELGTLEILVNNAAVAQVEAFEAVTQASFEQSVGVNLRGPFFCSQEFFKRRRKAGLKGGAIVNLGSLGGISGTPKFKGLAAYTMTKAGVVGLTEALAVEGRELGIRVNCVAPGAVDTVMLRKAAPHLKTETLPEHVAESIWFFCNEASSPQVTGATLPIYSNL